jgi:hypothetical protein
MAKLRFPMFGAGLRQFAMGMNEPGRRRGGRLDD